MSIYSYTSVPVIVSDNVIGTVVDHLVKYNEGGGIFSTRLMGRG